MGYRDFQAGSDEALGVFGGIAALIVSALCVVVAVVVGLTYGAFVLGAALVALVRSAWTGSRDAIRARREAALRE